MLNNQPSELCDLNAVDLANDIASGAISPVDLVESCITRIELLNPKINAVVTTNFDQARQSAIDAARAVKNGDNVGPLHGIPVLIKDLTLTKGIRTTFGSLAYANHVPDQDDIVVHRLKAAGAIILGKTNTPEFGAGANTNNKVFGATSNPHNTDLTVGGSSGGSAAAVAVRMAPLATGSDLGGSLRIPAAFCGIVGFRPTPGMIPSASRILGFSPLWTDGPMARTVSDVDLIFRTICGENRVDPRSLGQMNECRNGAINFSDCRIGFSTDLGFAPIDPMILEVFEDRKVILSKIFNSPTEFEIDLSAAEDVFPVLRGEEMLAALGSIADAHRDEIGDNIRAGIDEAKSFSFEDRAVAGKTHTKIYKSFQRNFDDIDFLICPTAGVSPFALDIDYPIEVGRVSMKSYYSWYALTWALSLVASPVLSIPFGEDALGMPFGIQVIGPRGSDDRLLAFAKYIEMGFVRLNRLEERNFGR